MANNYVLRIYFQLAGLFGTAFFYILTIVYLILVKFDLAIKLIIIVVVLEIFCGLIKISYTKPRPILMKNKTLVERYYAGSFPSIHSARAAATLFTLFSLKPSLFSGFITIFLVSSVGYSRIYFKKHYLTDVVAGIIIGIVLCYLI